MPTFIEELEQRGFAVVARVMPDSVRRNLVSVFDERAGRRDALRHPTVSEAAASEPVRQIVDAVLGEGALAVRATLFDKTPSTNWPVAWHQDLMIPVRARRDALGFDAWSNKDGIPHVRPPASVLQSMLAVRIDIDGTDGSNGPLRVIPGSHTMGILDAGEIHRLRQSRPIVECHVPAGGVVVMRPLLLHASGRTRTPGHRRIVHIEFAAGGLPGGVEWYERGTASLQR